MKARQNNGSVIIWCPGCDSVHRVDESWQYNGDAEKPTLQPSVLVTSGHFSPSFKPGDDCWCTYYEKHPDREKHFICDRCHSFVRDGKIEFLGDSTHGLAGQTVELPELDDWLLSD